MKIKEAIKLLRKELGMTQMELATELHASYSTVSRWERGMSLPSSSMASSISRYAKNNKVSGECLNLLEQALSLAHQEGLNVPNSDLYSVERESICQLVDDSSNAIYVADFETDIMLYANRKLEEFSGRKFDKEEKLKCYQFLLGRETPCPNCKKEELDKTGHVEKHIVSPKTGKTMFVSRRLLDWNGRKAHVQYFTDTGLSATEQDKTGRIIDCLEIGIGSGFVYNDGRIALNYLNDGYYSLLGVAREEREQYSGFRVLDAICEQDRERVRNAVLEANKRMCGTSLNAHIKKNDGKTVFLNIQIQLLGRDQDKGVFCCTFIDNTYAEETE